MRFDYYPSGSYFIGRKVRLSQVLTIILSAFGLNLQQLAIALLLWLCSVVTDFAALFT